MMFGSLLFLTGLSSHC